MAYQNFSFHSFIQVTANKNINTYGFTVLKIKDDHKVSKWKVSELYYTVLTIRGDHKQKYYWGHKEILVPVYKKMEDAIKKHPNADVLVSFASLRSAYESTLEAMHFNQVCEIYSMSHIVHYHIITWFKITPSLWPWLFSENVCVFLYPNKRLF